MQAMRSTSTINEIVCATGKNKSTIKRKLDRLGVHFLWKKGKGGSEKHYFIAFLPEDYRISLAAKDAAPVLGNPTDLAGQIGR